jgi:hypothetical protein
MLQFIVLLVDILNETTSAVVHLGESRFKSRAKILRVGFFRLPHFVRNKFLQAETLRVGELGGFYVQF